MSNCSTLYKFSQNAFFDFALAYEIMNDYDYETAYFTIMLTFVHLYDFLQTFPDKHL